MWNTAASKRGFWSLRVQVARIERLIARLEADRNGEPKSPA